VWASEPVWTRWRREKFPYLTLAGIEPPSLVTILTELQLQVN